MNGKERPARKRVLRTTAAAVLLGLLTLSAAVRPVSAASGDHHRKGHGAVRYLAVDRAQVENLQRWVAAGHEDWSKDARLVAARQLERIAVEFGGDAAELVREESAVEQARTFAWASLDGTRMYRVTVERFDWLLPIAGGADGVVWVPTVIEIQQNDLSEERDSGGVGGEPISKA